MAGILSICRKTQNNQSPFPGKSYVLVPLTKAIMVTLGQDMQYSWSNKAKYRGLSQVPSFTVVVIQMLVQHELIK